jgi:hypothetical protein
LGGSPFVKTVVSLKLLNELRRFGRSVHSGNQ